MTQPWTRALYARRETVAVAIVFVVLSVLFTNLKTYRIDAMQGDSAMFFDTTDTIAHRGVAESSVYVNVKQFRDKNLVVMPAAQLATDPLAPPPVARDNILRLHTYFILYPLALVAEVLPVETELEGAFAVSFVGLLALAFKFLRWKGASIAASLLFLIFVVAHAGWSDALLTGQFFPDRLFVLLGFAFMVLLVWPATPRWLLAVVGLLAAATTERSGVILGISTLAYVLLYWRRLRDADRTFKLIVGAVLLALGLALLKFVSIETPYDTFLPHSVTQALAEFQIAGFTPKTLFFLEMCAPLLLLALFEWRAAAIAVLAMLPNVFGYIGGAEKTGWSTHYHSYYLPVLVWAAIQGYTNLYRLATARRAVPAFYAGTIVLALLANAIDPMQPSANLSAAQIGRSFFPRAYSVLTTYASPSAPNYPAIAAQIRSAVPPGSAVSSPEAAMSELYHDRTVYFFPIGIDTAHYAVLGMTQSPGQPPAYTGITSYLGPEETAKANQLIVARMAKDGYDLAHPVAIPALGVAIVHRP